MSDEELDRDWKPNGRRPQSTIARSFSQELMDIFRIENSISDLDKEVSTRKETVNRNTDELASLEARIREMEDRLKRSAPTHSRPALSQLRADGGDNNTSTSSNANAAPKDAGDDKARSRPGTARAAQPAPGSGNMPPTPGASEDGHGE